jgi:hypothetical protein
LIDVDSGVFHAAVLRVLQPASREPEAIMKKLRLDLDRLEVETFAVADETLTRGTVLGMNHTRELYCTKADTCRDTSCLGGPQCTCPI